MDAWQLACRRGLTTKVVANADEALDRAKIRDGQTLYALSVS